MIPAHSHSNAGFRSPLTLVLLAFAVSVVVWQWYLLFWVVDDPLADLDIYRGAVRHMVDGGALYDYRYAHHTREGGYPFTYPPFAALAFLPLAYLPAPLTDVIWSVVTVGVVVVVGFIVGDHARTRRTVGSEPILWPRDAALATVLVIVLSYPYVHNFVLGQVSFLVAALALADAAGVGPAKGRGVMTGLAASLKLTPLIFIPYFVVTRQYRAASMATGVFLATSAMAFVVLPSESISFWSERIFDTGNVGEETLDRNKSALGILSRWVTDAATPDVLWLVVAAILGVCALKRARDHHQRGEALAAGLVIGAASIAISPISWSHHQLWAPAIGAFLIVGGGRWRPLIGIAIAILFSSLSPLQGLSEGVTLTYRVSQELPALFFVAVTVLGLGRSIERHPQESMA